MPKTIGQYRVGVDFNPSGNRDVDEIKALAAALIDRINQIEEPDPQTIRAQADLGTVVSTDSTHLGEVRRLKAHA